MIPEWLFIMLVELFTFLLILSGRLNYTCRARNVKQREECNDSRVGLYCGVNTDLTIVSTLVSVYRYRKLLTGNTDK